MASSFPADHHADTHMDRHLIFSTTGSQVAGAPRFDQMPSNSSTTDGIETVSHMPTTVPSRNGDMNEDSIAGSVYSYRSARDIGQFVHQDFGRTFNNSNNTYILPADETEWTRLDKQHSAFLVAMGGLYPFPEVIDAVLAPSGTEPKRIIDIGCGTGSWAIEMAIKFPDAIVTGVDLVPPPIDSTLFPPNLGFELDDINHGLRHFYGLYDFVHMRLARSGITDQYKTLEEMSLCLKPGGVLLIVECDIEIEDENHVKMKLAKVEGDENVDGVSEDGSWLARMHWEHIEAGKFAGSDWYRGLDIVDLGLWDRPELDPETAATGSVYMPIGAWAHTDDAVESQALKYVGFMMAQTCTNVHRAFHAPLLRNGITQEALDDWSRKHDEELTQLKIHSLLRIPFCMARRRAGEGLPAPPLPISDEELIGGADSTSQPRARTSRLPFPFFETFHSAEEALQARIKRRSTLGVKPTAAVVRAYQAKQEQIANISH